LLQFKNKQFRTPSGGFGGQVHVGIGEIVSDFMNSGLVFSQDWIDLFHLVQELVVGLAQGFGFFGR
jgi:hypothetical protein